MTATATASPSAPGPAAEDETALRVLHVITRMVLGGAQENTMLTVQGLGRMERYEVTLASGVDDGREGELLSRAAGAGRVVVVPELRRPVHPLRDALAILRLYGLIRRERFHIVHTHSSKAGVVGRIAAALARTPVVIHTIHGLPFHDYQPRPVNRLWRLVERAVAPLADHLITVSRRVTEAAVEARIAAPERFSTIYSGMELDRFLDADRPALAVRAELGIPEDAPVVGKVARLFDLKGHTELIDAAPDIAARHPGVRFLLVGDGSLRESLRERARRAGVLDRFVFVGLVPRERIPEMLCAMDVLVHTSWREGLARVLPQALATGMPCVTFRLDGAPEVVVPGETGRLVEPGDLAGLARAVSDLLADPELRARMGRAGRARVDPAFRAETMVREIAELYERTVARKRRRVAALDRA